MVAGTACHLLNVAAIGGFYGRQTAGEDGT